MKSRIKILITLIAIFLCTVMAAFITACADGGNNTGGNDDDGADSGFSGEFDGGLGGTRKQDYDMSGVVFKNFVVAYDGKAHSILATRLPEGVTAEYENNGQTKVGTYTVTAHFKGDEVHYNPIPDQTAILTIIEHTDNGIVSANGFEVDDTGDCMRLYLDVSNKTEHIDLSRMITVEKGCTWKLFRDFEGFEELPLKSTNLFVGDNITYAIVYDKNGDFLRYEISVYRLAIKQYTFSNEGNILASGDIEEKSAVEKPADPQKDYYTFKGWAIEGSTKLVEFPYTVTKNTVFVAQYAPIDYPITYNLDGGTNSKDNPSTHNIESDVIVLEDAYRKDYTFMGWYKNAELTFRVTQVAKGTVGEVVLYAKWMYGTEGLHYSLSPDNEYSVRSGYTGIETEVVIPATWDGFPVTAIGAAAFSDTEVTSVVIPEGIVSFGVGAFSNSKIKSLHVPASLTFVDEGALSGCPELEIITFAENCQLTKFDSFQFANCPKLKSIVIPDSITTIGYRAFGNCESLTSVTIGAGVTTIEREAFYECRMLESAVFKVTTGWMVSDRKITVFDGSNLDVNAYNLKITFVSYTWTRS